MFLVYGIHSFDQGDQERDELVSKLAVRKATMRTLEHDTTENVVTYNYCRRIGNSILMFCICFLTSKRNVRVICIYGYNIKTVFTYANVTYVKCIIMLPKAPFL